MMSRAKEESGKLQLRERKRKINYFPCIDVSSDEDEDPTIDDSSSDNGDGRGRSYLKKKTTPPSPLDRLKSLVEKYLAHEITFGIFKAERKVLTSALKFEQNFIIDYIEHETEGRLMEWLQNQQNPPFRPASVKEACGEYYSLAPVIDPNLLEEFVERKRLFKNEFTVVPGQPFLQCTQRARDFLTQGIFLTAQQAVFQMVTNGYENPALKLGCVDESHPNWKLANPFLNNAAKTNNASASAFGVYAVQPIEFGAILGIKAGYVSTGRSFEQYCAEKAEDVFVQMGGIDLLGSHKSKGGWVADDDSSNSIHLAGLVLDCWRKRNLLYYVGDYREDPLGYTLQDPGDSPRKINAQYVEARVMGWPYIFLVAVREINAHEEIIVDNGQDYWEACKPVMKRAEVIRGIQRMVNENLDKYESLNQQFYPMVVESKRHKQETSKARAACVFIQELLNKKGHKSIIVPLHQPGTLNTKVVLGALRRRAARATASDHQGPDAEASGGGGGGSDLDSGSESGSEEEDAEPDEAHVRIVSELQKLIFENPDFRPRMPQEVEGGGGRAVLVENPNCRRYLRLKARHGARVAAEVGRAWAELQRHQHTARASLGLVAWDAARARPLDVADVVLLLGMQLGAALEEQEQEEPAPGPPPGPASVPPPPLEAGGLGPAPMPPAAAAVLPATATPAAAYAAGDPLAPIRPVLALLTQHPDRRRELLEKFFRKKLVTELKMLCRERRLVQSGNKEAIVFRVADYFLKIQSRLGNHYSAQPPREVPTAAPQPVIQAAAAPPPQGESRGEGGCGGGGEEEKEELVVWEQDVTKTLRARMRYLQKNQQRLLKGAAAPTVPQGKG